ncbi:hypothetical protein O3P69_007744 [Scylla paramamosain]
MMQPENNPPSQNPAMTASKSKLEQTQQQVNEVVDIMKTNVENIMVRERELNDLDMRASTLTSSASEFQVTSRKLKKKYWWKNLKMMLILGGVVVFIIAIILIIVFTGNDSSSGDSGGSVTAAPTTDVSKV